MLNVVQSSPECKAIIRVCNEITDIMNEVQGLWETIDLLDDKLLVRGYYAPETTDAYENARLLLKDMIVENHKRVMSLLSDKAEAAKEGKVA